MSDSIEFRITTEPREPSWFDAGSSATFDLRAYRNGSPVEAFATGADAMSAIAFIRSERTATARFTVFVEDAGR